jgi:hypothetical protein
MRLKIAVSVVRSRPWAPRFACGYAWRSHAKLLVTGFVALDRIPRTTSRCRLTCLQRKRKSPLGACDQLARRANQQNLSSPARKNIPLNLPPKSVP